MFPRAVALYSSLTLFGCGMCGPAPSTEAPPSASRVQSTAQPEPGPDQPEPREADEPPPELRVVIERDPFGRRELRVENRGDGPAGVRSWVNLEVVEGEDYTPTSTHLRLDHGGESALVVRPTDTAECIEIVGGAALILPPWDFITRPANCPDHPEETLAAGAYRYLVQSCDERHRFPSSAFVLTDADRRPSAPCPE